jgi:PAS domain S-box-containing protein
MIVAGLTTMPEAFFLAVRPVAPVVQSPFDLDTEEILSLIGDGVVSIRPDGTIVLFNRAAEQLFGYTSAELIGCPIDVLIPMRFHNLHRTDVESFVSATPKTRHSMGSGREVLGRHKTGREFPVEATLSRHVFAGQPIVTAVVRDVTEQKTVEQQRQIIAGEVAHRLRNTMAVVGSIVSLTARGAASLPEFISSLLGRLAAVSRTNDALIGEMCIDPNLRTLLRSELEAFQNETDRFSLTGPDVQIEAKLALHLGLIFHELATNAAKYGAFSAPGGEIKVVWRIDSEIVPTLRLTWQEYGGPAVKAPTRTGFGSQLIARVLGTYHGKAEIIYNVDGVSCTISVPLVKLEALIVPTRVLSVGCELVSTRWSSVFEDQV